MKRRMRLPGGCQNRRCVHGLQPMLPGCPSPIRDGPARKIEPPLTGACQGESPRVTAEQLHLLATRVLPSSSGYKRGQQQGPPQDFLRAQRVFQGSNYGFGCLCSLTPPTQGGVSPSGFYKVVEDASCFCLGSEKFLHHGIREGSCKLCSPSLVILGQTTTVSRCR